MKKVIIIGGGIAGLSAGIHLQQAGFNTEIFEKHKIAGGQCTGWNRDGYHIDNCIHWLTGTKEGNELNRLWKNIGALNEDVKLYSPDFFYMSELNGEEVYFWKDIERTKKELLELSPEDANEINKFVDFVKLAESMQMPVSKPFDMMNLKDLIKLSKSMKNMTKLMKENSRINIVDYAQKFKHPLLKQAISNYMPKHYQAYAFHVSYATFTSGNGDIPIGGSIAMVNRMISKYKELGGNIHTNSAVSTVKIEGNKAVGIKLKDGRILNGDYVICACDTNYTFSHLLHKKYLPKKLKKAYKQRHKYPVISGFQVAFAVDGKYDELKGTRFFNCEEISIAKTTHNVMSIKNYDYEPSFSPKDKSIYQTNFSQSEEDYIYWQNIYEDKEKYKTEKMEIANKVKAELIKQYPFLDGKIRIIDVWTPVTYKRYCNAYYGAYMSFGVAKNAKDFRVAGKIKDIDNVMLASQWLMPPGGLPVAVVMGKFSAQRIMKKEGLSIE